MHVPMAEQQKPTVGLSPLEERGDDSATPFVTATPRPPLIQDLLSMYGIFCVVTHQQFIFAIFAPSFHFYTLIPSRFIQPCGSPSSDGGKNIASYTAVWTLHSTRLKTRNVRLRLFLELLTEPFVPPQSAQLVHTSLYTLRHTRITDSQEPGRSNASLPSITVSRHTATSPIRDVTNP